MDNPTYTKRERESVKLWLELSRCANDLEKIMDGNLRQTFGQSMSRFDVLSQLERSQNQGLTIGQLATRLIASKGNITGLLTRMETEGLLERRQIPDNRRSTQVHITPKGLNLFKDMARMHAEWSEAALTGLTLKDMTVLAELLRKTRLSIKDNTAD